MAFWQQVVVLATAVITLLSTLIGFATGVFRLNIGAGIFSSPGFWSIYGGLTVVLITGVLDYLLLLKMRNRLSTREWRIGHEYPPNAYFILGCVFWVALFVPYLFALGALASESAINAPALGVGLLTLFGLPLGGYPIALAAFDVDKAMNPWAYRDPK